MKCPKCGYELTEGHLYCDQCGEEMKIVPDFDPVIEKEMSETLSSLVVELAEESAPESITEFISEPISESAGMVQKEYEQIADVKKKRGKQLQIICVTLGFVLIAFLCIFLGIKYRESSASFQITKAKEAAAEEKYTQAIEYLEKAYELETENADILFLIADYYYIQEKYDFAVYSLERIIEAEELYQESDIENAYDKIISIYKTQNDYDKINQLLLACDDEGITTMFQQYMAKVPEFSYVGGNYDEVLPLKLSANTSGKIYYTLDGTTPNEKSEIYTAPIFLETGTYTVLAVFVNDYGIKSEVANNTYQIDLIVPSAPEVSVYSGDYYAPNLITAVAPDGCSIYYSTDASDPTADSTPYTTAIPMPLGKSVYKFVAISAEGVTSDITVRTYKLILQTEITTDAAIMNVIHSLMQANILLDEQGTLMGMGGHNVYKYGSVVRIGEGDYYVIYEYYEDATGIQTKTDRIYAVNIQDGNVQRITYDENAQINLIPIS